MARPLVTLHFAQSLDGRIGFGPGSARAILSSDEGAACAHRARARHDAVLIGIGTVLHDDPLMTARAGVGAPWQDVPVSLQPQRVVLDSELRLPLHARLLVPNAQAGGVLVFGSAERASVARQRELERAGAAVCLTGADEQGRVALPEVLDALSGRGVKRLLVEGGATVITSFLRLCLAARAEIEISPYLFGGRATPALRELGVASLAEAIRLDRVQVERLGTSVLVQGDIVYPQPSFG